jgi:phosphoglycolate phosphatase
VTHFDTVLFDLDGTIVDSAPGIVQSIAHTLRELGKPVPPMKELLHWVGPPLPQSFQTRGGVPDDELDEAVAIYREQYLNVGAYDSRLFDGMGAILRELKAQGRPIAIATSKPTTPATLMLEHFTLVPYFSVIAAAADDESRGEKHLIIDDALEGLADLGIETSQVIMVGDRIHDIDGARKHNIPSAVVRWGYGTPEEWAQADHQIDTPRQLRHLLGLPPERGGAIL